MRSIGPPPRRRGIRRHFHISKADYKAKYEELEHTIAKIKRALKPVEESPDGQEINRVLANIDEEFDAWVGTESFDEKQIGFLIAHAKPITVLQSGGLGIELDLIAGWIFVANKDTLGYIEKRAERAMILIRMGWDGSFRSLSYKVCRSRSL